MPHDLGAIACRAVGPSAVQRNSIEVNVASASPRYVARSTPAAALLLEELQDAHQMLLQAMSQLDELTRGALPAKAIVIEKRWKISRTSLARRGLWRRVHDYLSCRPSNADGIDLHRLQESDMDLLRCSSKHISKWSIDAVMNDWPAYCEDSRAIRAKMEIAIRAEMRILYPLLGAGSYSC